MKTKILIFLIIITTTFGCNKPNNNEIHSENEVLNETPQVLNGSDDYKISSISKSRSYGSDIISELYNEALEKNKKLKELNDEIHKMSQMKNDSLADYSKYSQTNRAYWASANNYINQLQDSILRESTLEIFKVLELSYQNEMDSYDPKLNEIKEKGIVLNDQLILMKLLITQSMIKNYQLNEKPSIKTLENIIEEYDKLIKESEEYTKIRK